MSARSKARKRALDVLFEADMRGAVPPTCWPTAAATSDEGQPA